MLKDQESDKSLLIKLKNGDTNAFDLLYEKYWQYIYTAAFKRLQDPDQAKDITQDVFLSLWIKREEANIENLKAYLSATVTNRVFNWMKREGRYIPIPELLLNLNSNLDDADALILRKEFLVAYEALIETLTPSQQKIFRMRYQQELSTNEIADKLELSRKTVQNQLGRALAQLRASLALISLMFLLNHK